MAAAVERYQELTTTHLQNQVDETVFLASKAAECGAIAASAFGAGFGEFTIQLISLFSRTRQFSCDAQSIG